jgi:gamma-glutamyltranspeptidase/glutathione hydrolase
MAPAIEIAEQGFPIYQGLAAALRERAGVLKLFPGTKKIFFRHGQPLAQGDVLIQRDLAKTLKRIAAKGAAGFYQGEVAKRIVAEMQRGRGLITQKDLDHYTVKHEDPVIGVYRGHQIVSMPPPSSGGAHIIEIMNILAGDDYGALRYGSAASWHLLAEAMRRAFADRAEYLGDPEFVRVPLKGLTSPAYGKALRQTIDVTKATPSAQVKAGQPQAYESPSTTHLSVVDQEGNAVSTTQTVNWSFGSGVVADGTGVVLNDEMDDFAKKPGVPNAFGLVGNDANAVAARKTPLSSMSPTLVFGADGKLELVVGSPGGPRIISATLQTILNVIDHKMPLPDAVHASRIHHQWLPDELRVEKGGLDPGAQAQLEKMGHKVKEGGSIGDVQAIMVVPGGLVGVSDTRSEGMPKGL